MPNETPKECNVLCPFCNAIQPSDFMTEIDSISEGCDTCGHGSGATGRIEVRCRTCERTVYIKEFEEY